VFCGACSGMRGDRTGIGWGEYVARDHLEDLRVDGMIILKWILDKYDWKLAGFVWSHNSLVPGCFDQGLAPDCCEEGLVLGYRDEVLVPSCCYPN
jgi:hypothetical protein